MSELKNFPMISQRDGDINQDFDCVPASIAACLSWLTGRAFSAREIKDAVYGTSYQGGTSASSFVSYCDQHGVKLYPINGYGSGMSLVMALHNAIQHNKPCLITEPDPYLTGWTHVCAAYAEVSGGITVMDPWIDAPVTKSDSAWASQLQENQIWVLEEDNMLQLTDPFARTYFTGDDKSWTCKATGKTLIGGILGFYRRVGGAPRLPLTGEQYDIPDLVYQVFESAIIIYDPKRKLDAPGGPFYPSYLLKLDTPLARKILVGTINAEIKKSLEQIEQTAQSALEKL